MHGSRRKTCGISCAAPLHAGAANQKRAKYARLQEQSSNHTLVTATWLLGAGAVAHEGARCAAETQCATYTRYKTELLSTKGKPQDTARHMFKFFVCNVPGGNILTNLRIEDSHRSGVGVELGVVGPKEGVIVGLLDGVGPSPPLGVVGGSPLGVVVGGS